MPADGQKNASMIGDCATKAVWREDRNRLVYEFPHVISEPISHGKKDSKLLEFEK